MFRKIDRVVLRVPNVASAVRYYRDVLGLRVVREEKQVASLHFVEGSAELILHADTDLPAEAIYFLVDDVRDLFRRKAELKLTFSSPPARAAHGWRATIRDPFGTIMNVLDRAGTSQSGASHVEDTRIATTLFADIELKQPAKRNVLMHLYEMIGRTADDLPYTTHFESLYEPYIAKYSDPKPTRAEVWRHLLNLRKGGKLPRLGDARSAPPEVDGDARARIIDVLGNDMGKRDRLPYTTRFDQIIDEFNAALPRGAKLSPHQVWRLVAQLAK